MEAELYKQNPWWESKFTDKSIKRDVYLKKIMNNMGSKDILFVTGLRRVGKTTMIKQCISKLLESNEAEDILFINLDSFNLLEYSIHDIISKYKEIHKKATKDPFYLFLDEVTSKTDFEKELKSIYDLENIKVICSSSTASYMNDKKALLTGRTRTIEIMPLTFDEFLIFKDVKINKSDKELLNAYFRDYLRIGGIPYYVLTEDQEYLNDLVHNIIYKDIIAYHNITNEKVVKELFVLLCERVGKVMSYNKLARLLHLSVDSIKRYVSYFEKTYLFYVVDKYAKSYNEKVTAPKKVYIGDVGIKNMVTSFKDLGASYENLVFLKIKSINPAYYIENMIEIDFITRDIVIEAKYNSEMNAKQKKVFDSIKRKKKIIAQGVDFFKT